MEPAPAAHRPAALLRECYALCSHHIRTSSKWEHTATAMLILGNDKHHQSLAEAGPQWMKFGVCQGFTAASQSVQFHLHATLECKPGIACEHNRGVPALLWEGKPRVLTNTLWDGNRHECRPTMQQAARAIGAGDYQHPEGQCEGGAVPEQKRFAAFPGLTGPCRQQPGVAAQGAQCRP